MSNVTYCQYLKAFDIFRGSFRHATDKNPKLIGLSRSAARKYKKAKVDKLASKLIESMDSKQQVAFAIVRKYEMDTKNLKNIDDCPCGRGELCPDCIAFLAQRENGCFPWSTTAILHSISYADLANLIRL